MAMADIELVIKLDKDIAQGIIDGENDEPRNIVRSFQATIADAIKNGTPLPKGHGRLIDADALIDSLDASDRDIYCEAVIKEDAPTVIEADKASEKKE
jgi:hypothetical protein